MIAPSTAPAPERPGIGTSYTISWCAVDTKMSAVPTGREPSLYQARLIR